MSSNTRTREAQATCPRCESRLIVPFGEEPRCLMCGFQQYVPYAEACAEASEDRRSETLGGIKARREPRGFRIPYRGTNGKLRGREAAIVVQTSGWGTTYRPRCPWCGEGLQFRSGHGRSKRDVVDAPDMTMREYKCGNNHSLCVFRNPKTKEPVFWS
jgi:hypothetical protein